MTDFIVKVLQRKQLSHSQSDQKHFIYMHSRWLEDATELEFLLTTSGSSYRATLKHDEIRKAAEDLEQPYDDIYAECKNALTTHMGLPGFDYELDEQQVQFKLYKCTGYETIYLEVPLRKVSNCYQLLDTAIECVQRQPTVPAAAAQESSSELATKYKEMVTEYEQFIKDTEEEKTIMLKKFLLLLNGKKKRIAQLEEQLNPRRQNETDSDAEMEDWQVPDDDSDNDDDDEKPGCSGVTRDDQPGFSGATQLLTQKD